MGRLFEIFFFVLIVGVVCFAVARAENPRTEERQIAALQLALEEREQRIESYEQREVMRCAVGELKLNAVDTVAAGELVYDYELVSGCKYMVLPEPNFVAGLVACGTLLLVLRKGTPRK